VQQGGERFEILTTLPAVSGPTPSMPSSSAALRSTVVRAELDEGAKALAPAARARKATAVFMVNEQSENVRLSMVFEPLPSGHLI